MREVLLMGDASMPGTPPPLRPRLIRAPTGRPAPWITMSRADIGAAMLATNAAWAVYVASLPADPDEEPPELIYGQDGSTWRVNPGGQLVPA